MRCSGPVIVFTLLLASTLHAQEAFRYTIGSGVVPYSPDSGNVTVVVGVSIGQEISLPTGNTQGFSMGNANDVGIVQPTSIVAVGSLAAINGGTGPDFFQTNTFVDGWSIGAVYSFLGGEFVEFDVPTEVVEVTYQTMGTLAGNVTGATVTLSWSETIGAPPTANVVVVDGQSLPCAFTDGVLDFQPVGDSLYSRGDCNADGGVNIADGIGLLAALFLGAGMPPCMIACDSNDDGALDATDATYLFTFQLLGGPPPPAPFPGCTEVSPADCQFSTPCPGD